MSEVANASAAKWQSTNYRPGSTLPEAQGTPILPHPVARRARVGKDETITAILDTFGEQLT